MSIIEIVISVLTLSISRKTHCIFIKKQLERMVDVLTKFQSDGFEKLFKPVLIKIGNLTNL